MNRRVFVRNGALALVGTAAVPSFLVRAVMAEQQHATAQGRRLVVIFQRGAADGLNIVVPYREPNYYAMRPAIAIPQNAVLDLDGQFGLHPAMSPLLPLYQQGHLAMVHAVGSPDMTRSHFDAQDYMESGTPGVKSTQDGWLNRAMQQEPQVPHASAFRAVALGPQMPRTLEGRFPAVALASVSDFSLGTTRRPAAPLAGTPPEDPTSSAFQEMYSDSGDSIVGKEGRETFEAMRMLKAADPAHIPPANGAVYPNAPFGNSMRQIAQMLKADLGVQAAFADIGDWDTHQAQGGVQGRLANRLTEFAGALAAFWQDLGDGAENVTVVTMSEFGRTARQNGTGGTDHGHGNVMFVLGGRVRGGKVYGPWPGLEPEKLNEGRDLAVTTDFRAVLAEASMHSLGTRNLHAVFPAAEHLQNRLLKFAKA